jgi:hypothetical protein
MTPTLIHGDHISCSRVGGVMRGEPARLRQHAQSLEDALGELAAWEGLDADAARVAIAAALRALRATADDLDEAGAALQRYATDLAESHELGRLLEQTRVIEPWGPASAQESERRRARVPEVQARVDLATTQVGRARGRLRREMTLLTGRFSEHSRAAHSARLEPVRPR